MGYEDIMNSYRFITLNAARTLHITDHYGIETGKPANFIVMDAENYYDALNRNAAVLYSFRNGRVIAHTSPASTVIELPG
jgi:cytosine deaminase